MKRKKDGPNVANPNFLCTNSTETQVFLTSPWALSLNKTYLSLYSMCAPAENPRLQPGISDTSQPLSETGNKKLRLWLR